MERVMAELTANFSKRENVELHVLLYGIKRDVFYRIPSNVIIHRPKFRFDNKFRFFHTVRTLWYLRQTIRRINPMAVLSFGERWNSFVLLATLGIRVRKFVSDRCQPDKHLGSFHSLLRRALYPSSTVVIAQTYKAKQLYSSMFDAPIRVIPNPIHRIPQNATIKRQNIVLSVGRLIDTKHHDRLVKLFLDVNAPDWKLVIVGGNALKQNRFDEIKSIIRSNNAEERVILAGERSDVDRFYLESKIFAFTSSSEGFPNVIGEAMSAGLPVISYDCMAGPSELIREGINGFLVPVFEDETFKARLQLLISNDPLRREMGAQALRDVQMFEADMISDQFFSLLTQ